MPAMIKVSIEDFNELCALRGFKRDVNKYVEQVQTVKDDYNEGKAPNYGTFCDLSRCGWDLFKKLDERLEVNE